MHQARLRRGAVYAALLLSVIAGCENGGSEGGRGEGKPPIGHPTANGKHEFISAEGQPGDPSGGGLDPSDKAESAPNAADDDDSSGGSNAAERTVEEGDIYRALGPGRLLNLNPYRGLQVIDIADVTKPKIVGRLRESGRPVELYMVGQRAIVLLNEWTGYWGGRDDVVVEKQSGGIILSVDLTDPTAPKITDREFIDGSIMTSRLTRQGERAALYVAASDYNCEGRNVVAIGGCARTVVKSIDVSSADLLPRTTLNLGGSVSALQATPAALIVARSKYEEVAPPPDGAGRPRSTGQPTTWVSLVDITNIDGDMVEGAQVRVKGTVQNKFNLDLRGNVLRVVSGSWGGSTQEGNHLETFDAQDRASLKPLHACTFGAGQQLFATLFLQDRAFFVTYLRQDPFHAFAIDSAGQCSERSEFIVSGWNDFFKPVFAERRLIGIGVNDEAESARTARTRRVAVSLYDITNLDNPSPLVARAEVMAEQSYSSASWDDKAFSVIEGAVSVAAASNPAVVETGLVLIPFTSYGSTPESHRAGVQIFTFSESTLTRRGVMDHGQQVERTFQPLPQLTANISAEDLSLFDTTQPDAPVERGRLELAPSYSDVLDYGSFLVRVHDTRASYGRWWGEPGLTPPPAYAEIIAKGVDPDEAAPLTKLTIPAGSRVFKVGTLLVTVATVSLATRGKESPTYDSTVSVFDLQNPAAPVPLGSVKSDRLLPANGYGWGYGGGECGMIDGGFYDDFSRVFASALVFGRNVHQEESIGRYEQCSTYVREQPRCRHDGSLECTWDQGYANCSRKVGSNVPVCSGRFAHCVRSAGVTSCTPVAEAQVATQRSCHTNTQYRYWQSMELDVLDLRNPSAPTLSPVTFARDEEALGLVAGAESVYFAFKRPHVVAGDPRPFAKYYFREVSLADPAKPAVGNAVNVPGQLLAVAGDRLFTRDLRWGQAVAETWLHALRRAGDVAEIAASHAFAERDVTGVLFDGAAHAFVTHRELWRDSGEFGFDEEDSGDDFGAPAQQPKKLDKLTIFSAPELLKLGETDVDSWSDMTQVVAGRVLFAVPGGLLVVNAQDVSRPQAQAYFPFTGYQRNVTFDGATILVAAGPYGIHQLDATRYNLLMR